MKASVTWATELRDASGRARCSFEQCLEIAFAEALVALALDDLEEDRPDHVLGEDLQKQALPLGRCAVHQYVALFELGEILAMPLDPLRKQLVIGVGRILEHDPALAQDIDRLVDIVASERDMLDALALILAKELLDLALVVLALVQRDPDLAARAGHRFGEQAGLRALDVEIANLAEVEEPLVEIGPHRHPAAVNIVGEMVDVGQVRRMIGLDLPPIVEKVEVGLVDRSLLAVAVDEKQRDPPMPSIAGMSNSPLATSVVAGVAPSFTARSKAALASLTLKAIAQADGPCALAYSSA
jgi:hypothetical protein